jgi:uncharacterized protein YbaP (TraB family)
MLPRPPGRSGVRYREGLVAIRKWVAAFLLATLAFGPLPGQADDAPQKHFLWKVTGPRGVVYLFGTIHIGKPNFYPLPAVIEDSFKHADTLVEEIKSDPADAQEMKRWIAEHGIYAGSDTIANHLSEQTIRHLAIHLKDRSWQEQQVIAKMRPWAIAALIDEEDVKRLGLDSEHGLDKHFAGEADQLHKPLEALETFASHLQLFSDMTADVEDKYLMQTLVDAEEPNSHLEMMIEAWQAGDSEKLQEMLTENVNNYPRLKSLTKRLLDDRNDAMTKQIEQYLSTSKTYFVAVGAAHMVGEHGIVSLLRAKQFTIEQL